MADPQKTPRDVKPSAWQKTKQQNPDDSLTADDLILQMLKGDVPNGIDMPPSGNNKLLVQMLQNDQGNVSQPTFDAWRGNPEILQQLLPTIQISRMLNNEPQKEGVTNVPIERKYFNPTIK